MASRTEPVLESNLKAVVAADDYLELEEGMPLAFTSAFETWIEHATSLPTTAERVRYVEILVQAARPLLEAEGVKLTWTVQRSHSEASAVIGDFNETYVFKPTARGVSLVDNGWESGAHLAAFVVSALKALSVSDTVETAYAISAEGDRLTMA